MAKYKNSRRSSTRRMGARSMKYRSSSVKRSRYKGRTKQRLRIARMYRNPLKTSTSKTMLIYNEVISLDPAAVTTTGNYVFSANGLYDPNITGTGHQPMYFDQYAQVYSKYRVNYSKIIITVINHFVNTSTGVGGTNVQTDTPNYSYKLFCITDNQSNDIAAETNQLIEEGSKNIKWRFISPALTGKMPKLFAFCSPHKLNGVDFKDDVLKAEVTANPGSTGAAYYIVGLSSADGVTNPPAVSLNIQIKYWVEFFDRKVFQTQN